MLEPKPITLKLQNGTERTFILSKFPAVAGREIVAKYPVSIMPKIGDYQVSEDTMLKLMAFVAVETDAGPLALTTRALIDNHAGDWETLAKLEWGMMEYNCSFFGKGQLSASLNNITGRLQPLISQIMTALSAQSSQTEKPPSTS